MKLFISHSSKTEENLHLLKKVCDALAEAHFNVLVDQGGKIPTGEEWYRYLAEWMAECDAAVILFSRAAFEQSQWVRNEAAILSWRKRIQPSFKLVGVLLDDVTPEEFDDDCFYKIIRISDFQFVRDFDSNDLDQNISKIVEELGDPQSEAIPSPFQNLSEMASDILSTLSEDLLTRTWNKLNGIDKPKWLPGMDYSDALVRMLLRDPKKSLENILKLLENVIHVLGAEKSRMLTEILKGLWVNPEAASELCWHRENKQAIAINCSEFVDFTGPCYVRRSWPHPQVSKLISAGTCRTLEDIHEVLLSAFNKSNARQAERRLKKSTDPLLLVFPHASEYQQVENLPDESLLQEINKNFPMVTIVVQTGSTILPGYAGNIKMLDPLLTSNEEDDQFERYDKIYDLIESPVQG